MFVEKRLILSSSDRGSFCSSWVPIGKYVRRRFSPRDIPELKAPGLVGPQSGIDCE